MNDHERDEISRNSQGPVALLARQPTRRPAAFPGAHATAQSEDSKLKPLAIPPDGLTRPSTQDDQARPAQFDNHPAESERAKNKSLGTPNIIAAISLLVAALSLIFSLNQSQHAEVSRQRAELIDYMGKIATLAADDSGKNHTFEIQALSSQAIVLLPNVPDVPATIYNQLAKALINATDNLDKAEVLLTESIVRATAANDIQQQIYAHQLMAQIRYRDRDLDGVRKEYLAAISLSDNYQGRHPKVMKYGYGSYTQSYWASDEAKMGHCEEARAHLEKAREWAQLALYAGLDAHLSETQKIVDGCRTE